VVLIRTIIAGSREFNNYSEFLQKIKECNICPTVIISGTAMGADKLGERFAEEKKIPLEKYPAEWDKYSRSAGYRRNMLMAEKADALIAFWNGSSKGTKHMIDIAKRQKLRIEVIIVQKVERKKRNI
jgi:hypothetical protein